MAKPTIIKEFHGQAVEEWRKRHHGFLPPEEKKWLESLITSIKASGWPSITEAELDELHALALAGVESRERYVQGEATVPLRLVNALIESLEPAIHYEGVLLTLSLRDRQAVRKAIADVRATISNGG
jgi:hypothetical protein